jgi:hypothetical protein
MAPVHLQAAGLTTRSEIEVSEAIRACAAVCLNHPSSRAYVDSYVKELLRAGWSEHDASEVRFGALQVVATITGKEAE